VELDDEADLSSLFSRLFTRRCSSPPLLILSLLLLLLLISSFLVHHQFFEPRGSMKKQLSPFSPSSIDVDELGVMKARLLALEKRVWRLEGRESHLGGKEERLC
jgi:hypothetical protein